MCIKNYCFQFAGYKNNATLSAMHAALHTHVYQIDKYNRQTL